MVLETTYLKALDSDKVRLQAKLDEIILKHHAQVDGNIYGDIIVSRDNYIAFINDLTQHNFAIRDVSWWCHCTPENQKTLGCPHGYGGPASQYYEGWFSERVHDYDEIDTSELVNNFNHEIVKKINDKVIDIIKNKRTITYADGTFQIFERDKCLTPGVWILTPDWKSMRYL